MKTLSIGLFGLCFTACVALASTGLSALPFVVGQQQFKAGDSIVIDEVRASSPKLEVGTRIVVRGHYRLASADKAQLGLFLTHRSPMNSDKKDTIEPSQVASGARGDGSFELSCEITHAGDAHISFYPTEGGEALGGIYFSSVPQKS